MQSLSWLGNCTANISDVQVFEQTCFGNRHLAGKSKQTNKQKYINKKKDFFYLFYCLAVQTKIVIGPGICWYSFNSNTKPCIQQPYIYTHVLHPCGGFQLTRAPSSFCALLQQRRRADNLSSCSRLPNSVERIGSIFSQAFHNPFLSLQEFLG